MNKKQNFLSTLLSVNEAGDLIVTSPNEPDRKPDFAELIYRELGRLQMNGNLSPRLHAYAVEITANMKGILTGIYAERLHGLEQAVHMVLKLARIRM